MSETEPDLPLISEPDLEPIYDYIDSIGRTNPKTVYELVRAEFPDSEITLKDIKSYLSSKGADYAPPKKDKVFGHMYSNSHNCWQMDILVDTHSVTTGKVDPISHRKKVDTTKNYYLICINMNTKYLYVSGPVTGKDSDVVVPEVMKFIDKYDPHIIYCDGEGAFTKPTVVGKLAKNGDILKVFNKKQHLTLSIVDRVIKTIRDTRARMKLDKSIKNPKTDPNLVKTFTFNKNIMDKIVNGYNRITHSSTGHTPNEMMDNPKLEDLYIMRQLMEEDNTISRNEKSKLEIGDKVRYIQPSDKYGKKRFKLKKGYYIVYEVNSFFKYTIIAADGSTLMVSRSQLVELKPSAINVPFGKTLRQNNNSNRSAKKESDKHQNFRPSIYRILYPLVKEGHVNDYWIEYPRVDRDGEFKEYKKTKMTVRQLREKQPTNLHPAEVEFYKLHPNVYDIDDLIITPKSIALHNKLIKEVKSTMTN